MTETTDTTVNYPSSPPALLQIATCLGVVAGIYCISARDEGNQMCGRGGQTPPSSRLSSEREGSTVNQRGPLSSFMCGRFGYSFVKRGENVSRGNGRKGTEDKAEKGTAWHCSCVLFLCFLKMIGLQISF